MKELNAALKSGKLDRVYVFSGAEVYLIHAYEKRLIAAAMEGGDAEVNVSLFEGEGQTVSDIISAAETVPFLAPRRLIILKNTGLLQTGKKDASDKLADYLPKAPDTVIFLFTETIKPPDKRGRLYKTAASGFASEFVTPKEPELKTWLAKLLAAEGVNISSSLAGFLLRHVGGADKGGIMENLSGEARKLAAYKGFTGEISQEDIETVCAQSIEGKIFALVSEIGGKNLSALNSLSALLALKEAPLGIMSMIARQFRLMLICDSLRRQGRSLSETAKAAGIRDFMASDFLRQSANFTEKAMAKAMENILEAEIRIKTGRAGDRTVLETLIIGLCLT